MSIPALSAVMPWLPALLASPGDVTPLGGPAESIAGYILGYGPIGVVALVLAWVLYKGLFVLAKTADREKAEAVALARADLLRENERLLARAEKAEGQRDEAMRIAQDKLVPLATSFTVTMGALMPILQEQVTSRERGHGR